MFGAHSKSTYVVDDERWGEGRRHVYRNCKTSGEAIYIIVGADTPTKKKNGLDQFFTMVIAQVYTCIGQAHPLSLSPSQFDPALPHQ